MFIVVVTFTLLHLAASIYKWPRNASTMDIELVRQHHEKCAMLGIIALCVLMK